MEFGREAVERVVEEHMEAFQEALGERVELARPTVSSILLALDRSNQDELVLALGRRLAHRWDARVVITGGFPDEEEEISWSYLEEAQKRLNRDVDAEAYWTAGEESFDKILRAIEEREVDLVVLPAPYLRDPESLGEDSVGTNLDVLLTRSPVPLLVVRWPDVGPDEALGNVTLVVFDSDPWSRRSAEWALALAREGALRTLAFVDAEFVELVESSLEADEPEEGVARRLSRGMVPLVSATVGSAEREGISADVEYVVGLLGELVREWIGTKPTLLVVRGFGPEDEPQEKVARDLILQSRSPVLVVKAGLTAPPREG